ncbi:hypothetical protein EXIGLDRAFT_702161 [Exidia glandulosa HHB12029]|uniref:Uncharacterized protein n=1 Tax=Exidia glandulosa HHB12029 TaxID=1314781 RepID=A0A165LMU2_EXIGL|nr:hypothetical protein EXIGLDRAFT_702161 [Exidia glandulosa HHB12029]
MSGRQPSALVSTGLAAATVVFNIAGAATDAVPIAKQILDSAAHISAFAERIHKKREAMYTLIRKVEVYSTQIDILVAGRVLDARLQQRLTRLLSVFVKIEALVEEKLTWKNYSVKAWQKFIAKPNRAEELAAELDHVMTLFNFLNGIQLSLVIDDTAHTVADDAGYDGQAWISKFRRLRDCDVEKLDVIHKRETNTGVIVWSSARVDSQLMVVRHVESLTAVESDDVAVSRLRQQSLPAFYFEYLKNIEKVSGSNRHIVQLYGRHVRGPEAVFRSGTINFDCHLHCLRDEEGKGEGEEVAVKRLGLDASFHLSNAHGLTWVGGKAIVDEHGEPYIGLFDDIVRADSGELPRDLPIIYWDIFPWFNSRSTEETGVVEQVHDTLLQATISQQLGNGNSTDRVQRVWDIIRQAQLHVVHMTSTFPIISGNLPLAQELIMRARLFFETHVNKGDPYLEALISFNRTHAK